MTPKQPNILSIREPIKFGAWNVRTMYEGGRSAVIAKEMRNYNLEILGLSETRWNEAGKIRLNTNETIIYSGHADKNANHTRGVAIMMTQKQKDRLLDGNL